MTTTQAKKLYETDYYAWTQEQIQLLKVGKLNQLDIANLIEEIADLGGSLRKELVSRLGILMGHLIKWEYQPGYRGASWRATIREQRRKIRKLLEKNPSLKSFLEEALIEAWEDALDLAERETGLSIESFPQKRKYELDEILDDVFLPE
ncbi:MAG TPA: DUF29 domain-containing protein [Oculatellaceae cyanobacterium]|jgi:hypothetical protein